MQSDPHFGPAPLAVTPRRHRDESVRDFVTRLDEVNGHGGHGVVLGLLAERAGQTLLTTTSVVCDDAALAALEVLAEQPAGSLRRERWRPMDSAAGPYFHVRGAPIPRDALMTGHAQVCPLCLAESGYGREDWELSAVTVCVHHRVALVDACPSCGREISLQRPGVCVCSRCAGDLRLARTIAADEAEVVLADFVAALAPYRLRVHGQTLLDPAESLFALCRVMHVEAVPPIKRPMGARQFNRLPIAGRRAAARRVAAALDGNAIDAAVLHTELLGRVAHRLPYVSQGVAMESVVRSLAQDDYISVEARRALSYGSFSGGAPTPVTVFGARLPSLADDEAAQLFLGCAADDWDWLNEQVTLVRSGELETFDAESLLAARRRLEKLVPQEEMDSRLGVPGLVARLRAANVLQRGAIRAGGCDLDALVQVLDRLKELSDLHGAGASGLVHVASGVSSDHLGAAYTFVLASALRNALRRFAWLAPYALSDLWIDASDAEAMRLAVLAAV